MTRPAPPSSESQPPALQSGLFTGGGEMGERMAALDWSTTALESPTTWPQSLRSALSICLGSSFPIAIYWGPGLTLVYNDAWKPIPGTKHPWALGRPARDVWPEIWDTIGPLFEQVMTTGEATYSEDSLLPMHRHGYVEECYFNFTFSPIRGEGGRVDGIFNAVIETTFRVIAERRTRILRALGEHTAAARSASEACTLAAKSLAGAPHDVPFCALYLLDETGRHARLAGSAGLPAPARAASIDLDEPAAVWPFARVQQSSQVELVVGLRSRLGVVLPGGAWPEPSDAALVAPMLAGPAGAVAGFLVCGISPRRAADGEYRQFVERAAAQVSAIVVSATAYDAARKRADALAEVDRAKTVFFSNVSHEFRTPLSLMLGPLEDALASPEQALSGEALRVTQRNALRLLKLVNNLLDFSRLEAGRGQASYQPVDLATLTADLASAFRSAMERAGLRYQIECDRFPAPVQVDRDMWEKIVLNLVSNAFKFTLAGSVRVGLRATEGGTAAELTVSDTGSGIPADELPHMFERFHRVPNSASRTHEGTGIGLALVHELVKLHGGNITVTSELGKGSTFTVTIPTSAVQPSASPLPAAAPPAQSRPAVDAEVYLGEALRWLPGDRLPVERARTPMPGVIRGRILVADDNADMRDYLRRLLEPRWDVQLVPDGQAALTALAREPFDLVITDVMMPRIDGYGLLQRLRRDPARSRTPVIMLSARAGDEARVEGIEAGADDYLVKPFGARELLARVAAQVELSRLRVQAQNQLAGLETLFMNAPFALALLDGPALRVTLQNTRHRELVDGRSIVGQPLLEALPELAGQNVIEILTGVLETGRPVTMDEVHMQLRRGGVLEQCCFNLVYQPVFDPAGRTTGIVAAGFDVTEAVRAREALTEANRAKDEFLAMLGHELRNPLAPIVTALEIMKLRGEQSAKREREVIERQVRHVARLVDDLLDVSRITRGKVSLEKERIDISLAIAKAIEIAEPVIAQRAHRLNVDVEPGLTLEADPTRLSQVVANLLTNAARYTPQGGNIEVTARREGDTIVVNVIDSGRGISADLLPRVFDLFVQGARPLDRSEGGLGLGLALVQSIVKMHGGTVSAHSDGPNRGSRFTFTLPALEPAAQVALPIELPPVNARGVAPGRGRRILLVDDNVDAALTLAEMLSSLGHEVAVAHDGPQALLKLESFAADIAVLDIGLPVMDGYELARRIRNSPKSSVVGLVAVTGYGQPEDIARCRAAGFDHHLVKPVGVDALVAAINVPART